MWFPSLTTILSTLFLLYVGNSIVGLVQLFFPPVCKPNGKCIPYYLSHNPSLQIVVFTSAKEVPVMSNDLNFIGRISNFNFTSPFQKSLNISLPPETQRNGSLYLHVFVMPSGQKARTWSEATKSRDVVYTRIIATDYQAPSSTAFQLLKGEKSKMDRPVTHVKSEIGFIMLTNVMELPEDGIPVELFRILQRTRQNILPLFHYDFLNDRLDNLREIKDNKTVDITFKYSPISIGKLRLLLLTEISFKSLKDLGFSAKDLDQIKGIFADTNIILLCVTLFVSSFHLLFDFLALKNDVSFWRSRSSLVGLSLRSILWRAFSQLVIFLYLLDEDASLLVLGPAGITILIEFWKVQKVLPFDWRRLKFKEVKLNAEELRTRDIDAQGMKYLSRLLYPLCLGGAVYSLLYLEHKSWYSWIIQSLVNGVYAFGFLFMLPQLFINYKLKSVAHLPWRSFMYKAFNTFIDDLFAFIITMPTAHRLACFRDDVVFVVYLYQRWLYPVDTTRIDESTTGQDLATLKKEE